MDMGVWIWSAVGHHDCTPFPIPSERPRSLQKLAQTLLTWKLASRVQADALQERVSMNADVFKGQWKQLKGDIKMRWNKLTDDDLEAVDGAMEKLEGKLQERYGWAKEQTQREIESWGRERGVWV